MRWVALMPLRAGSKSIPGKNVRPLAGRPLFAWSLAAAVKSGCFDEIWLASDSAAIRALASEQFPDQVQVMERSPHTATDNATTESVMLEFQEKVAFDVLCLIQATSPLTRPIHFREAKRQFLDTPLDSLLTAVETQRFFWRRDGQPVNYDPSRRPRRQDFEGLLMENGAFYFTRSEILRGESCRLGGRIGIYQMPAETAVEIDSPEDWVVVEQLLLQREQNRIDPTALARIAALVLDVDGTLTDGGMYYGPAGEAYKKFNTRDGMGLERLRKRGIRVCVITAENSPSVAARMEKLGIEEYFPGVRNKLELLTLKATEWGIPREAIAYMGDDLGDLACLNWAGLAFCPADAVPEVRHGAHHVCARTGGDGAVREVCELLLDARSGAPAQEGLVLLESA